MPAQPTKLPRYVFRTKYGVFRFKRNIPEDLQGVLDQKTFYKVLGRTYQDAMRVYSSALREFDELVAAARSQSSTRSQVLNLVGHHFGEQARDQLERGEIDENLEYALWDYGTQLLDQAVPPEVSHYVMTAGVPREVFSIKRALEVYWQHKKTGNEAKDRLPKNLVSRAEKYASEALGVSVVEEVSIESLTRKHANKLRDHILQTLKPTSAERVIGTVRTALNFLIKEEDLNVRNPFNGVIIKNAKSSRDDRKPLTEQDIHLLNGEYMDKPLVAALWATLRDTGARLSEVVYLTVGDVNLQDRSVHFGPNALRDDLKTESSVRTIPLSNSALEALQKLRSGKEDTDPIFAKYARARGSDAASQMLMKRLRKHISDNKKTIHSLRHSMKDALRNAGVEEALQKEILGHADGSVASRYGSGYSLESMRTALQKVW